MFLSRYESVLWGNIFNHVEWYIYVILYSQFKSLVNWLVITLLAKYQLYYILQVCYFMWLKIPLAVFSVLPATKLPISNFGCILFLGLSIPIEFTVSNSSKSVTNLGKLRVTSRVQDYYGYNRRLAHCGTWRHCIATS